MTEPRARRRSPRRNRGRALAWAVRGLLAVVVFGLGVGFGQALRDHPEPGGTTTSLRTLKPLPIAPARETVTVTVPG